MQLVSDTQVGITFSWIPPRYCRGSTLTPRYKNIRDRTTTGSAHCVTPVPGSDAHTLPCDRNGGRTRMPAVAVCTETSARTHTPRKSWWSALTCSSTSQVLSFAALHDSCCPRGYECLVSRVMHGFCVHFSQQMIQPACNGLAPPATARPTCGLLYSPSSCLWLSCRGMIMHG